MKEKAIKFYKWYLKLAISGKYIVLTGLMFIIMVFYTIISGVYGSLFGISINDMDISPLTQKTWKHKNYMLHFKDNNTFILTLAHPECRNVEVIGNWERKNFRKIIKDDGLYGEDNFNKEAGYIVDEGDYMFVMDIKFSTFMGPNSTDAIDDKGNIVSRCMYEPFDGLGWTYRIDKMVELHPKFLFICGDEKSGLKLKKIILLERYKPKQTLSEYNKKSSNWQYTLETLEQKYPF